MKHYNYKQDITNHVIDYLADKNPELTHSLAADTSLTDKKKVQAILNADGFIEYCTGETENEAGENAERGYGLMLVDLIDAPSDERAMIDLDWLKANFNASIKTSKNLDTLLRKSMLQNIVRDIAASLTSNPKDMLTLKKSAGTPSLKDAMPFDESAWAKREYERLVQKKLKEMVEEPLMIWKRCYTHPLDIVLEEAQSAKRYGPKFKTEQEAKSFLASRIDDVLDHCFDDFWGNDFLDFFDAENTDDFPEASRTAGFLIGDWELLTDICETAFADYAEAALEAERKAKAKMEQKKDSYDDLEKDAMAALKKDEQDPEVQAIENGLSNRIAVARHACQQPKGRTAQAKESSIEM